MTETDLCGLQFGDLVLVAVDLAVHALLQVLCSVCLQHVLGQLILHDLQLLLHVLNVHTTRGSHPDKHNTLSNTLANTTHCQTHCQTTPPPPWVPLCQIQHTDKYTVKITTHSSHTVKHNTLLNTPSVATLSNTTHFQTHHLWPLCQTQHTFKHTICGHSVKHNTMLTTPPSQSGNQPTTTMVSRQRCSRARM